MEGKASQKSTSQPVQTQYTPINHNANQDTKQTKASNCTIYIYIYFLNAHKTIYISIRLTSTCLVHTIAAFYYEDWPASPHNFASFLIDPQCKQEPAAWP